MSVISIALTVYDLREVSFPINPMISERSQLRLYQNFIKEENQEIVISPSIISDSKIFCTQLKLTQRVSVLFPAHFRLRISETILHIMMD